MRALHDLVTAGKIRYIGASSMWAYQFAMMQFCAEKNGWTKFVAMQVRSNLDTYSTIPDANITRTGTTFCTARRSAR